MGLAERFWSKVDRRGIDECWPWRGSTIEGGYGMIRGEDGRNILASHAALILDGVIIPDGFCACHTCDNPPCVNRRHLFVATHKANMEDKVSKRRQCRHEQRPQAKLTLEKAREIRAATGTRRVVAAQFGISLGVVNQIVWGNAWKE